MIISDTVYKRLLVYFINLLSSLYGPLPTDSEACRRETET